MCIEVILREYIPAISFNSLENELTAATFLPKKSCTFTFLSMYNLIPRAEFPAKVISWLGLFLPVSTEISKASVGNIPGIAITLLLLNDKSVRRAKQAIRVVASTRFHCSAQVLPNSMRFGRFFH